MPPDSPLILASGSDQRLSIFKKFKIPFEALPSGVSEKNTRRKKPFAIAQELAERKALKVAKRFPERWVVGIDTLVALPDEKILGKPKNARNAAAMLQAFSGRFADVYSGVALLNLRAKKRIIAFEKTRLFFRPIAKQEIFDYLKKNEWQNRSGAMTLEGRGGEFVEKIEGDYWNVIGVPTVLLNLIRKHIEC